MRKSPGTQPQSISDAARQGRLLSRPSPSPPTALPVTVGIQKLNLDDGRDGLLLVPSSYRADHPAPLVVMLHGAGGEAQQGLDIMGSAAESNGFLLLSLDSREATWDMLLDDYGPDVAFLDRALAHTFDRFAVDTRHIAISGFSDGASYALSLGMTNGDLWTHVIAFAPGFMAPEAPRGKPRLFISHGTHDSVLPIDRCSRRLVTALQKAGYDVFYHEFDGGHTVPGDSVDEAVTWLLAEDKLAEDKQETK